MHSLNSLYFHQYRINLKASELISLPPYKGSTLRGVFGQALRRAVCVARNIECNACMLKMKCVYSAIMESPVPPEHPHSRKYKNSPHPYIIVPPLTKNRYFNAGDTLSFDFTLIGKANNYLPYFVYTFTEMGKLGIGGDRGRFDVISVEELRFDGTAIEIYSDKNKTLKNQGNRIDYKLFMNEKISTDEITLNFETPVRIKEKDNLTINLSFSLLVERLSERAFLLAHFHCGAELGNFKEFAKDAENTALVKNNLKWLDWERYSSSQDTKMKFGGGIGGITYKGDFQKYMPLLRLGEYLHVGKEITFGLGKYRIYGV